MWAVLTHTHTDTVSVYTNLALAESKVKILVNTTGRKMQQWTGMPENSNFRIQNIMISVGKIHNIYVILNIPPLDTIFDCTIKEWFQ